MTKDAYLEQLSHKLRVLPDHERRDALEYYEGYLHDAEDAGTGIEHLGTPDEAAAKILAQYVATGAPPRSPAEHAPKKHGAKTAWLLILALFAIPIGLPIAISAAAVALSLFVTLVILVAAFAITGVALILSGIALLIGVPFVMTHGFGVTLLVAGAGLFLLGFGIMFQLLISLLWRGFHWIARFVGGIIQRRAYHA
ncbi:MAG: DUF1700 domain-containing protein [Defluviitaleaceae bacterium]|nr:DUF1700 domain-containing protein [Defluviitaleaceae bacterium]